MGRPTVGVSEELSSVETVLNHNTQMNLILVSEELSSVETRKNEDTS